MKKQQIKDIKQNPIEEFCEIYEAFIERAGADKLLDYLKKSDFCTAPASTRFHLAEESGLIKHSINVYKRLVSLVEKEYGEDWENVYSHETVALVSLLHDACKIGTYKVDYRNVKDSTGAWVKEPFYKVEEDLPYGHGEKSVYIVSGFIRLSREEAMAINWHMGGFDERAKSFALSSAMAKYPLAVMLHTADFLATYLDEKSIEGK
ncbi:MAG: hydrolase [Firmicutes bacterium]|nr:hydrolase [Bacillota bacterium]